MIQWILISLYLLVAASCFELTPLVVSSHRLVKGLKQELEDQNPLERQGSVAINNMLKRLITECSSDAYVILDLPGLTFQDVNDFSTDNWPFLSKYFSISSTVVGVPYMNEIIDLDHIKDYIGTTCQAELMTANIEDENSIDYIDTKKKIINILFNRLDPEDKEERNNQIQLADEFVRKIIRKLPSPHYTVILTSSIKSSINFVPQAMVESNPAFYGAFHEIMTHPHRLLEIELNNPYRKVEPHWNEEKNTNMRYLANKKQDVVKFLDYELWMKHEKLIMTIVIMVVTIGMIRVRKLFNYLFIDDSPTLKR